MPSGTATSRRSTRTRQEPRHARVSASLSPFLSRIQLAAAADGQPRTSWAQILRTGEFYDPRYGDFEITRAQLATMVENFVEGRYPVPPTKLTVDYNHGTGRVATAEEGKSAGWVSELALRGNDDELWGLVEWTDNAAALIEAKEYQFTSATFSWDYTSSDGGEDLGPTLLAFALTNRPVIHGMQPLALSMAHPDAVCLASRRSGRGQAPVEAATLFSYDEQRRRVQAAISATFGVSPYVDEYCYGRGVYLEALYDDMAVYSTSDGSKFQVGYAIGSDGSVAFTSDPVECRVSYEPLSAPADVEETAMATIKVKDAKGNPVELAQETVAAIVKDHAPAPAQVDLAALPAFKELQATVAEQATTLAKASEDVKTLSAENLALKTEAREKDANTRVDALVREGRIAPADRAETLTLAMDEPKAFAALEKQLAKRAPIADYSGTRVGSGEDRGTSASVEVIAMAKTEMEKDPKLSMADATQRVFTQNPTLYERYKGETAVKV